MIRPIFVISAGRSGSTIFANTLAKHSACAFLTVLHHRYPRKQWFHSKVLNLLDIPGWQHTPLAELLKLSEAYGFWECQDPAFRRPMRDLVASDVTEASRRALQLSVLRLMTGRRNRFLAKLTGWPRVGYLNEVFPKAKFIHLIRDGRNVATSFLKLANWRGWEGPSNWRFGPLSPEFEKCWVDSGRSFVVLAGLYWRMMVEAAEATGKDLPGSRFMTVRYEDFVRKPRETYRQVTGQCGLEWTREFDISVKRTKMVNMGHKWKTDLTLAQQKELMEAISKPLQQFGYLTTTGLDSTIESVGDVR